MRLDSIRIQNFRNHRLLEFEPGRSVTNIYGNNGSGKTSILESVHYCALTKSFNGTSDRDCLKFGEEMFSLRSVFVSDQEKKTNVFVAFSSQKEKRILVNDQELQVFSAHIGTIPCVTFTPREMVIITGSPAERRRFADMAICQYDRKYLSDLMQYKRVLQQRNALLSSAWKNVNNEAALEALTEQIVVSGSEIIHARKRFIEQFGAILQDVYRWMPEGKKASIEYTGAHGSADEQMTKEELRNSIRDIYKSLIKKELERGLTLAGPHRDDLHFFLDGKDIRKYASQGQQRAFLVALKMTMHEYLYQNSGEKPISLLDDLFSELDDNVSAIMIETLSTKGQVIITSTNKKNGYAIKNIPIDDKNAFS